MKTRTIKKHLLTAIDAISSKPELCGYNPGVDFSRKRKITLKSLLTGLISMEGKSLSNEVIDIYKDSASIPSTSAFVQQRNKLKPEAVYDVFREFTKNTAIPAKKSLITLAVDGSEITIPDNPDDTITKIRHDGGTGFYNSLYLNALYDLSNGIYIDAEIQNGTEKNEHMSLQHMVDRSDIPQALIIADRGYESYNNLAHIQEKGWYFLIRVKDGAHGMKSGLDLPADDEFDIPISLSLTRKQTNEMKQLLKDKNHYRLLPSKTPFDYLPSKSRKHDPLILYQLNFRIVRFHLKDDTYETIVTNLDSVAYPPEEIKRLYALRWGIETSFRNLKYTMGLLKFHSKKAVCIRQEIYAKLIMYNFVGMITSHVIIKKKQRKHIYKANFSTAAHACRLYFLGNTSPPVLESIIASFLIPIRPDRHRKRYAKLGTMHEFFYRIA
ncbi:MAG: IS4 family transposase [Paludibacteraceae bacterium]|nr:IS4 family transposase [Paludibacteraceae bacterium]